MSAFLFSTVHRRPWTDSLLIWNICYVSESDHISLIFRFKAASRKFQNFLTDAFLLMSWLWRQFMRRDWSWDPQVLGFKRLILSVTSLSPTASFISFDWYRRQRQDWERSMLRSTTIASRIRWEYSSPSILHDSNQHLDSSGDACCTDQYDRHWLPEGLFVLCMYPHRFGECSWNIKAQSISWG